MFFITFRTKIHVCHSIFVFRVIPKAFHTILERMGHGGKHFHRMDFENLDAVENDSSSRFNPFAPCSADLHYIFIQPRGLLPCEELGQFFDREAVLQRYTSNFNIYFFEILC